MTTIWVTKYALTSGIHVFEAIQSDDSIVVVKATGYPNDRAMFFGKDWHNTKEAALERAEEMRQARIKSLQKSLEKMKRATFRFVAHD